MKTLYSFAAGIAVAGLFAWAQAWGIDKHWEDECVKRGGGYYTFNMHDKLPAWNLKFHWFSDTPNQRKLNKTNNKIESIRL